MIWLLRRKLCIFISDQVLSDLELNVVQDYKLKHRAFLEFLKQKEKIDWIMVCDESMAVFHQSIKSINV